MAIDWDEPERAPDDVTRFMDGDCWYLAKRLHRIANVELWSFENGYDGKPTAHAFVRLPDGRCLDVEGISSIEDMAKAYGYPVERAREFKASEMTWSEPPWFGHYTYARARRVADELLEKHGLTYLRKDGKLAA